MKAFYLLTDATYVHTYDVNKYAHIFTYGNKVKYVCMYFMMMHIDF